MVKKNKNEKYGGTGYEIKQAFCSPQPRGFMTSDKQMFVGMLGLYCKHHSYKVLSTSPHSHDDSFKKIF